MLCGQQPTNRTVGWIRQEWIRRVPFFTHTFLATCSIGMSYTCVRYTTSHTAYWAWRSDPQNQWIFVGPHTLSPVPSNVIRHTIYVEAYCCELVAFLFLSFSFNYSLTFSGSCSKSLHRSPLSNIMNCWFTSNTSIPLKCGLIPPYKQ